MQYSPQYSSDLGVNRLDAALFRKFCSESNKQLFLFKWKNMSCGIWQLFKLHQVLANLFIFNPDGLGTKIAVKSGGYFKVRRTKTRTRRASRRNPSSPNVKTVSGKGKIWDTRRHLASARRICTIRNSERLVRKYFLKKWSKDDSKL